MTSAQSTFEFCPNTEKKTFYIISWDYLYILNIKNISRQRHTNDKKCFNI